MANISQRDESLRTSRSAAPRVRTCQILVEDVDLAAVVPTDKRGEAEATCLAPVTFVRRGRWIVPTAGEGLGLLVLEGLLIRRVGIDGRHGAEVIGEGDLLRPWQTDTMPTSIVSHTDWRAVTPLRLAVLDHDATARIVRYPEIVVELVAREVNRVRNLAMNMAIVQQPRVDVRLEMMLWTLADRWGRVGPGGVVLPLRLTHQLLGELVAARRPTVSTTLAALARSGRVVSTDDGWVLSGEPPGELLGL